MPNTQLLALLNLEHPQPIQAEVAVEQYPISGQAALKPETPDADIITEHPNDARARKYGWLTFLSGETYNAQIMKSAETDMQVFVSLSGDGSWEAWRETWKKGFAKSSSTKIIARGVPFNVALQQATRYAQGFRQNR